MNYKYKKSCDICGVVFNTNRGQTMVCSEGCRQDRLKKITGRYSPDTNIPSGTVGAISELMVSSDLMKKGYSVFRALSPSCFCDIIAIKKEITLKIEIRTGYMTVKGKIFYPKTKNGIIDAFGIYERNRNECYYFNSDSKPIEL